MHLVRIAGFSAFLLTAPLVAQDKAADTSKQANPFDLSAVKNLIGTEGVPTADAVAALEQQSQAAMSAGDCKQAVELMDKYARKANALANLIASGLQP